MKILRAIAIALAVVVPVAALASPSLRASCCGSSCCPNCPLCPHAK
jgi:hypothetical protein